MKKYRIVPYKSSFDDFGLIYKSEKEIEIGTFVKIFQREKEDIGVCFGEFFEDINYEIKEISEVFENMKLPIKQIKLAEFLAKHYFSKIHHCLKLVIPGQIIKDLEKGKKLDKYNNLDEKSGEKREELVSELLIYKTKEEKSKYLNNILKNSKGQNLIISDFLNVSKIFKEFEREEGNEIFLYDDTDRTKANIWLKLQKKDLEIKNLFSSKIGLFLPFYDLENIIIDLNDSIFTNNESSPKYNIGEVTKKLQQIYGANLFIFSKFIEVSLVGKVKKELIKIKYLK